VTLSFGKGQKSLRTAVVRWIITLDTSLFGWKNEQESRKGVKWFTVQVCLHFPGKFEFGPYTWNWLSVQWAFPFKLASQH
jgi:hypothetical protein